MLGISLNNIYENARRGVLRGDGEVDIGHRLGIEGGRLHEGDRRDPPTRIRCGWLLLGQGFGFHGGTGEGARVFIQVGARDIRAKRGEVAQAADSVIANTFLSVYGVDGCEIARYSGGSPRFRKIVLSPFCLTPVVSRPEPQPRRRSGCLPFRRRLLMCLEGRLFHCGRCNRRVVSRRARDRGHLQCSNSCSDAGCRERRRKANRRYAMSERGREWNRRRQQLYRMRRAAADPTEATCGCRRPGTAIEPRFREHARCNRPRAYPDAEDMLPRDPQDDQRADPDATGVQIRA